MSITSINATAPADMLSKSVELAPAERARAARLRGAALRNATPAQQSVAVSAQFEAVLVRQLLGNTITSMLGREGGAASSIYGDLLTDVFAQNLTAGSGLGLARMIEKQLTPRAAPAADDGSSSPVNG